MPEAARDGREGPNGEPRAEAASRPPGPLPEPPPGPLTISLDAMGGDKGPEAVVAGLRAFLRRQPESRVVLHGPADRLRPLVADLGGRVRVADAQGVVAMTDKPSQVMRHGQATSMWSAVESVRGGEAEVVVSCGNTGALMAVAMLRLRRVPGVARPAIAILWPSRNPGGFNVVLDVGADVRADAEDLRAFALMGTTYCRQGFGTARPRVGLLNVGTEEHKGRPELREAHELIAGAQEAGEFDFVGFVEGGDIPGDGVDVVVTDGFTGNVALKTGEGTASFVASGLRDALTAGPLGLAAGFLARRTLRRLRARIDPRKVNGGVFLGLGGTVVKSHGAADETAVAAALDLAHRLASAGLSRRVAARVASALARAQGGGTPAAEPAGAEEP